MVSESIRQRLMPIIMEKLLTLAPGYTGSRISYRDSFRDSVDIDSLPEEYYKNSQEWRWIYYMCWYQSMR